MSKLCLFILTFFSISAFCQEKAVEHRIGKTVSANKKIFNEGISYFNRQDYQEAYSSFIEASESSNITKEEKAIALFNAGLSLERDKKYKKAIEQYNLISIDSNLIRLYKDTYYRISSCCHELKDWACVIASLENWKNYGQPLSLSEEFEYRIRKGTALYALGLYSESIEYLSSALKAISTKKTFIYDDAKKKNFDKDKIDLLMVWGLEELANSYKTTGDNIKITYYQDPEDKINMESLSRLLELKAYYYIKAQDSYLMMLEYGDSDSASKGLYLLGQLYVNIYKALLESDIPSNIKKLKLEKDYKEKLKTSLEPILKKARTTYNKNIELSKKYNFTNEWIEKSKKDLKDL